MLNSNRLSGNIPAQLGNLSNLNRLRLHGNQLNGSIPRELGGFSNLTQLGSVTTNFRARFQVSLVTSHTLKTCESPTTIWDGPIPPELGRLTNLVEFYLSRNNSVAKYRLNSEI